MPSHGIVAVLDMQIALAILEKGLTRVAELIAKVLELLSTEDTPERRVLVEELLVAIRRGLEETSGDLGHGWRIGSIGPRDVGREVAEVLNDARTGLQAILARDPALLFAGEVGEALRVEFAAAAEQFTDLCRQVERPATDLQRMVGRSRA